MKRLFRDLERAALDLEDHATRANDGDVAFDAALTGTHAGLGRLLRERVVREDADVDLSVLLHRARDRDASRFDLTRREPARSENLKTVFAERNLVAAFCIATHVALLHFAELGALGREHRHTAFP